MTPHVTRSDVTLIGAGIMSATLGTLLRELDPSLTLALFERLDHVAGESSAAWNNAGTGHAGLCELNYTPQLPDGTIATAKALRVRAQFERSRELWASLVGAGRLGEPGRFIHRVPHLSFVSGEEGVEFLRARALALSSHHLFGELCYTEERRTVARWAPLVMEGRHPSERLACTRAPSGTDVDFGALTRALLGALVSSPQVDLRLEREVESLSRTAEGAWRLEGRFVFDDTPFVHESPFVFIGAGGAALTLLEQADLPEAAGYAGFPVGGRWLRCTNRAVIARHHAKVYGLAEQGSPPMSVPHLDSRIIDGDRALLFGPFAAFSTKFLKRGSWLDLAESVELDNFLPLVQAGLHNLELTEYLVRQARLSHVERVEALRRLMPTAEIDEWELVEAGQRVQVIKDDEILGGVLEFGTEVVVARDGSIAALLGASPGASTAVSAMLELLERAWPERFASGDWQARLEALFPSWGRSLEEDAGLAERVARQCDQRLGLVAPSGDGGP